MGKIKRERQKLHHSSGRNKPEDVTVTEQFDQKSIGKSPLLKSAEEFATIPDNLFEGIDINFDNLKQKLVEDDRVSIKSIAKSCKYDSKGKLLTKKEKHKIKHDLFMRKINTAQQLKKEALQKHKKRKGLRKNNTQLDTSIELPLDTQKSFEGMSETSAKQVKNVKFKGVKKAKVRQREMLQDISCFRKILADLKHTEDPDLTFNHCLKPVRSEMSLSKAPR
uniref:Protein FAM207A n=1 Tax=Cuerna arida TaxID=1464854 RepID=A0A1B6FZL1_9HEMI